MPIFRIETNLPKDKIPSSFAKELNATLAKILEKPAELCSIVIVPGMLLTFGGSDEPCAQVTVSSIGKLGVNENKIHSKILSEKIEKDLGIPSSRMYIFFNDVPSSHVGYKGTTFHEIMGK